MNNIKEQFLDFFKDLKFEEKEHIYKVNGKIFPSVSKLIKKYYPKFDAIAISEKKAAREGLNAEELRKEWKDIADKACNIGHIAHSFGENYKKNKIPNTGLEKAIANFWNDLPSHIIPICYELKMYHKILNFCGTADILLYNTINNTLIIADYKTNKDLFKNFAGQKMLNKFKNLLDNPFNHYQIQLSFYQILIEQLSIKVSRRIVIHIKEDSTYNMYDTEDYTSILINDLKNK